MAVISPTDLVVGATSASFVDRKSAHDSGQKREGFFSRMLPKRQKPPASASVALKPPRIKRYSSGDGSPGVRAFCEIDGSTKFSDMLTVTCARMMQFGRSGAGFECLASLREGSLGIHDELLHQLLGSMDDGQYLLPTLLRHVSDNCVFSEDTEDESSQRDPLREAVLIRLNQLVKHIATRPLLGSISANHWFEHVGEGVRQALVEIRAFGDVPIYRAVCAVLLDAGVQAHFGNDVVSLNAFVLKALDADKPCVDFIFDQLCRNLLGTCEPELLVDFVDDLEHLRMHACTLTMLAVHQHMGCASDEFNPLGVSGRDRQCEFLAERCMASLPASSPKVEALMLVKMIASRGAEEVMAVLRTHDASWCSS